MLKFKKENKIETAKGRMRKEFKPRPMKRVLFMGPLLEKRSP